MIVDNKPGGLGTIGVQDMLLSPRDGARDQRFLPLVSGTSARLPSGADADDRSR